MDKLVQGAKQLGIVLSKEQTDRFQLYYEELVAWNRRMNLTAITEFEEVQVKHFLDSLTVVPALGEILGSEGGMDLLDVGTGAGLPGIPIKLVVPQIRLVLLESVTKKTGFLKHVSDRLGLENVEVLTDRAEELAHQPEHREAFDAVVSRAVSRLPTVAELSLPFCRLGGLFIAQKKGAIEDEVDQAARAIKLLGGRLREIRPVASDFLTERSLVIVEKVSSSPQRYPRRPGIPAKRPL
ncbi:MAG: 16S rRNA (guanine(527)-N(7))-methyltransferase RsmG [Chloroflexi bacterium]|nr:MAG: 16S rRNA (guanine(527)-N(7))-methyltransferase RsmG [Chloroflexota bacterium]